MNKVTKSECIPDKRDKRATVHQELVGTNTETDSSEAEQIRKLVTDALAELNQKPDNRKYG